MADIPPGELSVYGSGFIYSVEVRCMFLRHRITSTLYVPQALPGMNAASVGLILASVFRMTLDVHGLSTFPAASLCIGLLAFVAVDGLSLFEPLVVVMGIAAGLGAWVAKLH